MAVDGRITGWVTEPDVDPPSYAVTEPIESGLNLDTVLLLDAIASCHFLQGHRKADQSFLAVI